MSNLRIFLVTFPADRDALKWAKSLVERKLAACVNLLEVKSLYWWKGKIEEAGENLLLIKTSSGKSEELRRVIESEHPYSVPEIVELEVEKVNQPYLRWVLESIGEEGRVK